MRRILVALGALAIVAAAHAQQFPIPGKPVRIVVPFPPGGAIGIDGFLAFFGPADMPPAVVDAVYRELAKAITSQEIKDLFFNIGYETGGMPPADFVRLVRSLHERWGAVIRELGIKIDQ